MPALFRKRAFIQPEKWRLLENFECVTQRPFAIDSFTEALNKDLSNDLVIGIHNEHAGMRDAVSRLPRLVLLVENPESRHRRGIYVGDERVSDTARVDESLL